MRIESAMTPPIKRGLPVVVAKACRDSQGSLPKTGSSAYLDDNATEL
jgi:hypothetical protein